MKCEVKQPTIMFDATELRSLTEQGKLHEAVCLLCNPTHARGLPKKPFCCRVCQEEKPPS